MAECMMVGRWDQQAMTLASLFLTVLVMSVPAEQPPAGPDEKLASQAREVLRQGLGAKDPWVRVHAAEALLRLGQRDGIAEAFARELESADSVYAIGCRRVLYQAENTPAGREQHLAKIREALRDPKTRVHALETLAKLRDKRAAMDTDVKRDAEGDSTVAAYAAWLVANSGDEKSLRRLADLLKSDSADVRLVAAYALRHLDRLPTSVLERLEAAVGKEPARSASRVYLLGALYVHGGKAARQQAEVELRRYARDGKNAEKYETCTVFGQREDAACLAVVVSLLEDADTDVRIAAAHAFLRISSHPRQGK